MVVISRIFAATALAAIIPRTASACSVCLGDPSSAQVQGMNMAILLLLGVITTVLGGVGLFGAMLWRRAALHEGESNARRSMASTTTNPNIG
jgi:hypothetical protein